MEVVEASLLSGGDEEGVVFEGVAGVVEEGEGAEGFGAKPGLEERGDALGGGGERGDGGGVGGRYGEHGRGRRWWVPWKPGSQKRDPGHPVW